MNGFRTHLFFDRSRMPLVLERVGSGSPLEEAVSASRAQLEQLLVEHGALLFRGFAVDAPQQFEAFLQATGFARLEYLYRSTPRTSVADRVYTATEYPPALPIPFHNENAYQRDWPMKLAFCCLVPAATGGETPLADMRKVTAAIGPAVCEQFQRRGVSYIRHYRPHVDLPWQTVFQTEDKAVLGLRCRELGIEHEWLDAQTLRTIQVCQGTALHPATGESVFFNQAHLFHVSSLGEGAQSVVNQFGLDRLPRHARYGDGEEIPAEQLDAVRKAFASHGVSFPWQAGDVLLLDNMQVAHARRPFTGRRKVLASLMDAYSTIHPRTAAEREVPAYAG